MLVVIVIGAVATVVVLLFLIVVVVVTAGPDGLPREIFKQVAPCHSILSQVYL